MFGMRYYRSVHKQRAFLVVMIARNWGGGWRPLALGPCTFAYMASMIGSASELTASDMGYIVLLLMM
jgi:hypothetical protein